MGKGGDGGGENMALWLLGVDNLKIQPLKLPPLGPNDVLVRMKAVGICGTDVHYLKHMMMTRYVVKEPMVLGHECAGIIEELGSEVKNLAVGDRVALDPGLACENCNHCKDGRQNLCEGTKCLGLPPDHGGLANKVVHPAHLCYKLPDNVSLEEGAVCEPLSVAVHACRRAKINSKSNALIVGAGTIGLLTMFTARAYGAQRIIVVDVDDRRISVAKSLGADEVLKVSTSVGDVDKEVELIQKTMGCDIDVTFDCAGFSKTMATALLATRTGGIVCLVGMGHNDLTIPLTSAVAAREVDILGAFRYIPNTWPQCIEFLASGKIDVKPLITHRFGLNQEDVQKAFEASAGGGNAIKVMFTL